LVPSAYLIVVIRIRKPTRCTISQLYFGKELYMFRTYRPSSGVLILYSQQLVFVILVMLTVC